MRTARGTGGVWGGHHFTDGQRGSHGSTATGLLAACLPRNASCERLFSGERGGRWRGGLTLSLRAASRLPAARPLRAEPSRAEPAPGLGAAPAGTRSQVGRWPGTNCPFPTWWCTTGSPGLHFYLFSFFFFFLFLSFFTQDSKEMVPGAASLSRSSLLV